MSLPEGLGNRWVRTEARPLGDRFPALREVADQPVDFIGAVTGAELSARVRTMLSKGKIETCGDLGKVSEEELSDLRHVGRVALGEVLTLLRSFEDALVSLAHAAGSAETSQEPAADTEPLRAAMQLLKDQGNPVKPIEPQLHLLAQWSLFTGRDATLGALVDAVSDPESLPADVRAAWDGVRAFDMQVAPMSHRDVLAGWLESLPARERDIVTHRIVWADRTLDEVGQLHGVTRERIRQLERQLRDSLEERVAHDDWRPVRWAAHRLAEAAGAWARLADIRDLDPWQDADRLVVFLAGLEVDDEEELIHRHGFTLPRMDDLVYRQPEGEVLDDEDARRRLVELGVLDSHADHALRAVGLKQIDDTWVRWSRSYVDQSVAILAVVGEPMTADELTERTGSGSVRSLRQRLHDDPRVQRVNRTDVGLRSWGLPEYTSVAELMLKVIADRGGSMRVTDLATHLERVYEVKPGTLYAYTAAPAFVLQDGTIRARGRSEQYEVDADPADVAGLAVLDEDRFSYDVRVDHEVLRGSGRPAPEAIAGLLGLQPGRSLHFTARDAGRNTTGSVVVGWSRTSHMGPYFGSVRAQALHDGAEDGDLLRLTFDSVSMVVHHERVDPRT